MAPTTGSRNEDFAGGSNESDSRYRSKAIGFWVTFVMVVGLFCFASPAGSQTVGGVIQGTVTDQSGATIAGVNVLIKNVDTGVVTNAKTNGAGFYTAPTLPPGRYQITATVPASKRRFALASP